MQVVGYAKPNFAAPFEHGMNARVSVERRLVRSTKLGQVAQHAIIGRVRELALIVTRTITQKIPCGPTYLHRQPPGTASGSNAGAVGKPRCAGCAACGCCG